jgi:hypothetical protein
VTFGESGNLPRLTDLMNYTLSVYSGSNSKPVGFLIYKIAFKVLTVRRSS